VVSAETGTAHRRAPVARLKRRSLMPTEAKRETVAALREEVARSRTMIVSEYRGLAVKEIAEIRRALRRSDVSYRVVKNRLLKLAAEGPVGTALGPMLSGPNAIAFGTDEAGTARAVIDAIKPYKVVQITGAVLGDKALDAEGVKRLASLPGRETLLAEIAGGFAAPLATTAGLIAAPLRDVAGLLGALHDQKAAAA
jgi:large subunit ribosomal protein L10